MVWDDHTIFATGYFLKKDHTSFSWLLLSVPGDLKKVPNEIRG